VQSRSCLLFVCAIGALSLGVACAGDTATTMPTGSVLNGLVAGTTNDSSPVTTPPPIPTPGWFRGTVTGHVVFYNFTDTLSMLPRVAGARLTAYTHVPPTADDTLGIGPEATSVVTDNDGHFQFPMLAGATYVVTVEPPPGSPYRGVWVTAIAHSHSADYPWFVVLPTK